MEVLSAHVEELLWVAGLFAGVVITAALVNRFRPAQRARVRRLVTSLALYALAVLLSLGFAAAELPSWATGCLVAAQILQAFTVVSLAATLIFSLMLPAIGLEPPMIASDLIVGIGFVIVTVVTLSRHGVDTSTALVPGAVVSAVLAISLQSTLGNIVGGIALQLDGSIREGDWIQLENGKQGRVRSVRWRHTVVETRDWSTLVVPNAQLLATQITILGKRDGHGVPQRMWVWFSVDFRFAPERVIEVVSDALHASAIENVAAEPKPSVVCMDFAKDGKDSVASYAVRYWIEDLASDDPTNSRVRARIYAALQRAQIPLAVPAHTAFVELKDDARTARRASRQLEERLVALKTVHLFHTLTDDELRTLAMGMSHVTYADGELITKQGATAHWLYVLTDGRAEVRTCASDPPAHAPSPAESLEFRPLRLGVANLATRAPKADVRPEGASARANGAPLPPAALAHAATASDHLCDGPDQHALVAKLTAPDFFGEMSLMTGEPRSADVVATGDVDCFRLGKSTFKTVLLGRPEIATELSSKLARRRVELMAVRGAIDPASRSAHEASERERILRGIKSFFALGDQ